MQRAYKDNAPLFPRSSLPCPLYFLNKRREAGLPMDPGEREQILVGLVQEGLVGAQQLTDEQRRPKWAVRAS